MCLYKQHTALIIFFLLCFSNLTFGFWDLPLLRLRLVFDNSLLIKLSFCGKTWSVLEVRRACHFLRRLIPSKISSVATKLLNKSNFGDSFIGTVCRYFFKKSPVDACGYAEILVKLLSPLQVNTSIMWWK